VRAHNLRKQPAAIRSSYHPAPQAADQQDKAKTGPFPRVAGSVGRHTARSGTPPSQPSAAPCAQPPNPSVPPTPAERISPDHATAAHAHPNRHHHNRRLTERREQPDQVVLRRHSDVGFGSPLEAERHVFLVSGSRLMTRILAGLEPGRAWSASARAAPVTATMVHRGRDLVCMNGRTDGPACPVHTATPLYAAALGFRVRSDKGTMGVAALISWLVTAFAGLYLLALWLIENDVTHRGAAASRLPAPVILGHVLPVLTGLVVWMLYLLTGSGTDGWAALGILVAIVTLGLTMLTRWIPVHVAYVAAEAKGRRPTGFDFPAERAFPLSVVISHGPLAVTTFTPVLLSVLTS
jgi:hypothetical protein